MGRKIQPSALPADVAERLSDPVDLLDWAGRGRKFRAPPLSPEIEAEIERLVAKVPLIDAMTEELKRENDK